VLRDGIATDVEARLLVPGTEVALLRMAASHGVDVGGTRGSHGTRHQVLIRRRHRTIQ